MQFIIGAALVGCNESNLSIGAPPSEPGVPSLAVVPPALEWGRLRSNERETRSFVVRNIGDTVVTVSDVEIVGVPSYTVVGDRAFLVPQGEEVEVTIAFSPTAVSNDAVAIVHSDDPDEPTSFVQLSGIGSVPELTITPETYDFGELLVPCEEPLTLTLGNTGEEPLRIDAITHHGEGFSLVQQHALPLLLDVGQSAEVEVLFAPQGEGHFEGILSVASNDPRGVREAVQSGAGRYADQVTENLVIPTDPPVDILFAVDQSCSMDTFSSLLGANFADFIGSVGAVTADWQIGVPNVEDGCFNEGILTPSTSGYTALFQSAVVEGDDPGGLATLSEKLLELTDVALEQTAPGGCNAGFLRPGARLHVILVSDEPNRSPQPWATYLQSFQSYLASPGLLTVSAIIDDSGCSYGGEGYPEIVLATGGMILDLCGNWSDAIADLGAVTVQEVGTLPLTHRADPDTVQVRVNGEPSTGWSYDPASNAIVFEPELGEGTAVTVDYAVLATCE